MNDRPAVCIVGAGPRGISVFERLVANFGAGEAAGRIAARGVDVHIVDPHEPGGGRIWRRDQPDDLLMNTVAGHATQFTDDSVRCVGPITAGPTVNEWAHRFGAELPADLAVEAAAMSPWSHPTRRFHGHYLRWVFDRTLDRVPAGMRVVVHHALAVSVRERDDGRQVVDLAEAEPPGTAGKATTSGAAGAVVRPVSGAVVADAVVLTTGHGALEPTAEQVGFADFGTEHTLAYVPPGNPIDLDLSGIEPGTAVLVRGLGMNFFDVMSMLTVGRGGVFEVVDTDGGDGRGDGRGRLRYRPSGREPVLYAGSRRGVPYQARGSYGRMPPTNPPRYFDDAAVARLRERAGTVDFGTDVWPLIAKEAGYVYYDRLLAVRPSAATMDPVEFLATYDRLGWTDPAMAELVAKAFADPADRLDFSALDRPLDGRWFADRDELNGWLIDHLRADATEAHRAMHSPLKQAMTALGATRARVRVLAEHGGLRGGSQLSELDGWFRGFAASVASGPPVRRIEELLALAEAGLLIFVGPRMWVGTDDVAAGGNGAGNGTSSGTSGGPGNGMGNGMGGATGRVAAGFIGGSPGVGGDPVVAPALIDAYLPDPDLRRTADPLWRQLRDSGASRPYRMADTTAATGFVETGGVEVTTSPHHLVTADGVAHPRRFALGIPVEPVHWATAIGAMAQANADLLRQTDAVARAVLRALV